MCKETKPFAFTCPIDGVISPEVTYFRTNEAETVFSTTVGTTVYYACTSASAQWHRAECPRAAGSSRPGGRG